MGHRNTQYTNTHSNHLNDTAKKIPLSIPWDNNLFNNGTEVKQNSQISGDVLKELRQHAKAIAHNYTGNVPDFSAIPDSDIDPGDYVESEDLNETQGSPTASNKGLLDGIEWLLSQTGVAHQSGVSDGQAITNEKIDEIVAKLNDANNYSNYSNAVNSGYNQRRSYYYNHVNHRNRTRNRGWRCHRDHWQYSQRGGYYHNHTNHLPHGNYNDDPHANYNNTL